MLYLKLKKDVWSRERFIIKKTYSIMSSIKVITAGMPDAYYFGAVIKRQEEKLDDYNSFKAYIQKYHKVGIKKYYGLTLMEYLDLTPYEKNILCDQARGFKKN